MAAANYNNAKRILKNSEAKISQSSEGIYDQNSVVLFWDNIEARYINECVNYLNDQNEQPVLTGPTQFYDTLFTDDLFHLHAYYDEDADRPDPKARQQRIYRIMMRDPIGYTATNWATGTSKWKLYGGDTFTHGPNTMRTLYMQNVKHDDAIDFETQSLAESYTDAIYLLGGDVLAGEWYSIERKSEVNPKTGLYTLYWFLSKHQNTDLYFKIQTAPNEIRGYFYKREATETTLDTLLSKTFFDNDTGEYVSDPGKLTANGTNAGDVTATDWTLTDWDATGRAIYTSATRPTLIAAWSRSDIVPSSGRWVICNTSPFSILYSNLTDTHSLPLTGWVTIDGSATELHFSKLSIHGNADLLSDRVTGRTVINRSTRRDDEDRLWDIDIEIIWVTGESEAVQTSRSVSFVGKNINQSSTERICATTKTWPEWVAGTYASGDIVNKSGTHYRANKSTSETPSSSSTDWDIYDNPTLVTWADFKMYIAGYRGQLSVRENEDETIDYVGSLYLDAGETLTLAVHESNASFLVRHNEYGLDADGVVALAAKVFTPNGLVI